jgi:hypothetical protein
VCLNDSSADENSHITAWFVQLYIWSIIDCYIVEGEHGFECCWCLRRQVLEDVLLDVRSTQRLLSGIAMSFARPSLSVLIKESS